MTAIVPNEIAQRIKEILGNAHDEAQNFDGDSTLAVEIDLICGLLDDPLGKLFTVVYEEQNVDIREYTVRASSRADAIALVDQNPALKASDWKLITVVEHGNESSMQPVGIDAPVLVGEYLYFTDPDDAVSSGLYRVESAPNATNSAVMSGFDPESYGNSLVCLHDVEGNLLQVHAHELRRSLSCDSASLQEMSSSTGVEPTLLPPNQELKGNQEAIQCMMEVLKLQLAGTPLELQKKLLADMADNADRVAVLIDLDYLRHASNFKTGKFYGIAKGFVRADEGLRADFYRKTANAIRGLAADLTDTTGPNLHLVTTH